MAKIFTLAVGLALAFAVVACEGEDGTPRPETATPVPSATPTPGASPERIDGVEVVPLATGDEVGLPEDVALLVELGCIQCDGPTTGLARVYRDPLGELRADTLFQRPEGGNVYISSFALSGDGSDIIFAVCSRGYCGPFNEITQDAQTTLYRSRDGGVTWAEFKALDGAFDVVALSRDGVVLRGPYDADPDTVDQPPYQLFPSGEALQPPAGADPASPPVPFPGGELAWRSKDGRRLLGDDGSELFALALGTGSQLAEVVPSPGEGRFAVVWWQDLPSSPRYYLGIAGGDGQLMNVFSREDGSARVGGWLDAGLAVGNATVSPEQLQSTPPDPFVGDLPVLLDVEAATVHPVPQPFLDPPFLNGRNRILAVLRGPFARVAGTDGCLNVREKPAASGTLLECAAEGVLLLLRGLEDTIIEGGVTWVHVVTPAGADGWASGDYLER